MSAFTIEYYSCYAHLIYDFIQSSQRVTEDKLARIDAIAQKYVKMSCGTDEQSRHTRSHTFGCIIIHRTYLPALLDELVPVFEEITSATTWASMNMLHRY